MPNRNIVVVVIDDEDDDVVVIVVSKCRLQVNTPVFD